MFFQPLKTKLIKEKTKKTVFKLNANEHNLKGAETKIAFKVEIRGQNFLKQLIFLRANY